MRVDYHVHTEFSDDSDYAMEQVIKDAITMVWTGIWYAGTYNQAI